MPLVGAADREEVIGYESSVMLHCTIFKTFISIATENQTSC